MSNIRSISDFCLREGETLTKKELISRLRDMDVKLPSEQYLKEYYIKLYNAAITSEEKKSKIKEKLIKDIEKSKADFASKLNSKKKYQNIDEIEYFSKRQIGSKKSIENNLNSKSKEKFSSDEKVGRLVSSGTKLEISKAKENLTKPLDKGTSENIKSKTNFKSLNTISSSLKIIEKLELKNNEEMAFATQDNNIERKNSESIIIGSDQDQNNISINSFDSFSEDNSIDKFEYLPEYKNKLENKIEKNNPSKSKENEEKICNDIKIQIKGKI